MAAAAARCGSPNPRQAHGFVILVSAGPAWCAADQSAADRLRANGALVVGADRAAYVAALDKASCYGLVGEVTSPDVVSSAIVVSLG